MSTTVQLNVQSLSSVAKAFGLSKSTLSAACKKLGIPTNKGLTQEQIDQLVEANGYTRTEVVEAEIVTESSLSLVKRPEFTALTTVQADTTALSTDTANTKAQNEYIINAVTDALLAKGEALGQRLSAQVDNLEPALLNVVLAGFSQGVTKKN